MKTKLIFSVFVASMFMTSCGDDFLEPVITTELLTQEQLAEAAENNPDIIAGTVNGIYTLMITADADQHSIFGQKSYDIFSDMLSGDMALTNNVYNWYQSVADYQSTVDYTRRENNFTWRYYFNVVKSANSVISTLGGNDVVPTNQENKWLMGQAKALRGYAYFNLAQFFAREYDPAREILPIYTETGMVPQGKSTTADVYALIVSDLNSAISLLGDFNRTQKHQINKPVAQGLLAYTYAAMGNYPEVKTVTNDIITNGGFPLTTRAQTAGTSTAGFNDVATPSWMWGYDLNEGLGLNLISWWGQMDLYTYSYAWAGDRKSIDATLYASIPTGDVRKTQYSASTLMPINKFYHPGRVAGGQRFISTDYIYMRVDEMYLLNAEACAKTTDEPGAKARLAQLLTLRLTGGATAADAFVATLAGQTLKDEIYKQTRIEFWGEGKSYFAMKRNQATINRGPNHLYQAGVAVPYNDDRLSFDIPLSEIQNNPLINSQN